MPLRLVAGDQEYVVAPVAVKVVVLPLQTAGEDGLNVKVGNGFTVSVKDCTPVHPFEPVALMEYTVVIIGLADTDAPVVVFNPVLGDQV